MWFLLGALLCFAPFIAYSIGVWLYTKHLTRQARVADAMAVLRIQADAAWLSDQPVCCDWHAWQQELQQ